MPLIYRMEYKGQPLVGIPTITPQGDTTAVDNGNGTTTYTETVIYTLNIPTPDYSAQIAALKAQLDSLQALQGNQITP